MILPPILCGATVTTPDFEPDSLRAWATAVADLAAAPRSTMRQLGTSVAAMGTTAGGQPAVALSFGEETSDQAVSVAVTPDDARRIAEGIRSALDALSHD